MIYVPAPGAADAMLVYGHGRLGVDTVTRGGFDNLARHRRIGEIAAGASLLQPFGKGRRAGEGIGVAQAIERVGQGVRARHGAGF